MGMDVRYFSKVLRRDGRFTLGDGRNIHVNVDPFQKRAGYFGAVFVDLQGRAAAVVLEIRKVAAETWRPIFQKI